jgi:hypothetical protein
MCRHCHAYGSLFTFGSTRSWHQARVTYSPLAQRSPARAPVKEAQHRNAGKKDWAAQRPPDCGPGFRG